MTTSAPGRASQIIFVEDDESVRDVTVMILEGLGYNVRATDNGFEALRWLEEVDRCDLLMLDLKMPAIDGPTLYREVRARWPKDGPGVLFVSGFTEAAAYAGTLQAIAAPVLEKPFTLDLLSGAVERALALP